MLVLSRDDSPNFHIGWVNSGLTQQNYKELAELYNKHKENGEWLYASFEWMCVDVPCQILFALIFFSHLRKISWALYGWTDWLVNIKRAYSKIAGGGYFRFRDFSISNKPIWWPRAWLKWTNQGLRMHKIQSWIPNFLQGANQTHLFSIDKWVTPELCLSSQVSGELSRFSTSVWGDDDVLECHFLARKMCLQILFVLEPPWAWCDYA